MHVEVNFLLVADCVGQFVDSFSFEIDLSPSLASIDVRELSLKNRMSMRHEKVSFFVPF